MSKSKDKYDSKNEIMWLYRKYDDPDTLVPEDELKAWSRAARDGETPGGDPIKAVNYIFADEDTAEYNHAALAFAQLGTFVGSLRRPKSYEGDEEYDFDTREDFGI